MAAPAADDDDHRAALPREEDDGEEEEGSEEEVESDEEEEEEGEGYDWSEEDDPEAASLAGICDPDAGSDDDPTFDPAADGDLEVDAVLRSRMARMSLSSARKDRKGSRMPKMGKEEMDLLAMVDKLMHDGQLEKLKVYECKAYLRMHKLRLSGNKEVLLTRIREQIEYELYPLCDSCKGDVVVFEQNIYKRKKGAPRGVKGHLCGQRTNAGRIIKESYGTKKQQHTFTIEILWSRGYKPWPPLHPLLIKGRNLYKDKTMRQPWLDEEERNRALQEKHARGYVARKTREVRIKDKENERMRRLNRNKENKSKGQDNMNKKSSQAVFPQHTVTTNTVQKRAEKIIPSLQHGESGNSSQQHLSSKQTPTEQLLHYLPQFPHPQQHNEVLLQKGTSRTSTTQLINHQAPSLQHAVKVETTQQQQQQQPPKSIKPAPIQQSSAYPQQYPKHQHHNQALPRVPPSQEQRAAVSQTSAARQDFTNHQAPPSRQHGGSENMRRQEISSRPTPTPTPTPQQAVSYTQQQPPNHQYRNEAFWQQGGTSTSRTGFMDRQSNNWGSTDHDKPAFQPFTQKAKTYQHGSNGSGHHQARVDRETHQPLRSRNQDYHWEDQSYHHQQNHHQNYYGHRQMSQDQYHHQQNHHQNYHGRQGMNGNQYHDRQNHNQNPQRFRPWKPCFIYQQQGWCPYGENCKFMHDLR
uniref:C3H1-type domain-containing protein n=1 Tax=Oryza barthii TaxID=65489 RepID=A0A0D3HD86_9ORYZ